MNSRLSELQSYPFEKLRALLAGLAPEGRPIPLSIGEPQHATPDLIRQAVAANLAGLSVYPTTAGLAPPRPLGCHGPLVKNPRECRMRLPTRPLAVLVIRHSAFSFEH